MKSAVTALLPLSLALTAACAARTNTNTNSTNNFTSVALGLNQEFKLAATAPDQEFELARPAYIIILGISTCRAPCTLRKAFSPWFDFGYSNHSGISENFLLEAHAYVFPMFPLYGGTRNHFRAGRHRRSRETRPGLQPRECATDEEPTLKGCRKHRLDYVGMARQNFAGMGGYNICYDTPGRVDRLAPLPNDRSCYSGPLPPVNRGHYLIIATEEFVDPYQLADDLTWASLRYPPLLHALLENDVNLGLDEIERVLIEYPEMPPWAALYVKSDRAKSADALTRR